ncbi:MAG: type IVB secretion system protein IcmH/DotU [Pseudomonadales bacterium]|nr:type IVB secretion system protein IcmH/DotU [Pseudomonadales bacterium]NRA17858.1 DotU family type IV/VI secretion system protein [Oceanospirillaceae bacterium]
MSMDFLDEETIEVSRGERIQLKSLSLAAAAPLKNRELNLSELGSFKDYDNPLLSAGTLLLSDCVVLSRMEYPSDMYRFRKTLVAQITELKHQISKLNYPPSVAEKCCFLFCIVLDEFILHGSWGEQSSWENHTLVSDLFGMRDGGEQFFVVTEKALLQPKLLHDLLELVYIFLRIGFRGQYRHEGREQLEDIMYRIEQVIFEKKAVIKLDEIASPALPKQRKPRARINFMMQLVLLICVVVILLGGSSYLYQSDYRERAVSFTTLATFNRNHLLDKQGIEVVYRSVESEMLEGLKARKLNISRVKSIATKAAKMRQTSLDLTLEIAAFTSRLKAIQFLRREHIQQYGAQVIFIRDKYRVVLQPQSESRAEVLIKSLRDLGFTDVSYYYHTKSEAK